MGVFFIVGRGADQFAANGECIGETPGFEVDRKLRAFRIQIGRIESGGALERDGRVVEKAEP
jgi:hypothetical protein